VRVVDLDRDMRDVIPTGTSPDSEYVFAQMTRRTLALARPAPGRRVLDVASGLGQDVTALAGEGAFAVGLEPSARMAQLARELHPAVTCVRGWSDGLPFASGAFDAVLCKGAIDHFDQPLRAIAAMARVTKPEGRVVLAIANYESLACRLSRGADAWRERVLRRPPARGRRHYDVPHDHFTRYELGVMREQASRSLELEVVEGLSLLWGFPPWTRSLARWPAPPARAALAALGGVARRAPAWADVVLLAGRPRRSATTSA